MTVTLSFYWVENGIEHCAEEVRLSEVHFPPISVGTDPETISANGVAISLVFSWHHFGIVPTD
jgi:hypothetical protein